MDTARPLQAQGSGPSGAQPINTAVDALPDDADRALLREAVRAALATYSKADAAGAGDGSTMRSIWRALDAQGLAALGQDRASGALREILIVMEELGRAACPAPLLNTMLLNLLGIAIDRRINGEAPIIALSHGQNDGDHAAGQARLTDDRLCGSFNFVEAAPSADYFAVLIGEQQLAVVNAGVVTITPTRAMGIDGLSNITVSDAPATLIPINAEVADDLVTLCRLGLAARALGAAERALEMAVDYARTRHQFGQPIGRFQAIQHKLANAHIALRGVALTLANAAQQHDLGNSDWRWFAAAGSAQAAATLRQVSLETQHAFGAIGYSNEHEAPRHFRRVHLDVLRHDAQRASRARLAAHFLDQPDATFPQYDLGAAGNAFREEVRNWVDVNWSGARKAAFDQQPFKQREFDRDFARALGRTGWLGLSWPRRFGGQERSALEQIAFMEEMERVDAPRAGAPVQAAMLQVYGTPDQQQKYLPEILRGEAIYGMGYSEPDAGSDLAAMRTRAVRDGDHYVINGQKIWTTTYWGEYMLLATRTDPDAVPKHAGLSLFIVPMTTPGITVKPSTTMYDGTFANIFYDDVRLPADAMIGRLNDGWRVLTGALATERGFIGGGIVLKVARAFEQLCRYLRTATRDGAPLREDAVVRDRIGDLAAQIEAGRQMMIDCAMRVDAGETPLADAAVSKVYSGELMERFGEAALDLLGMEATLSEHAAGAILGGRIEQNLRHSLMWVISIGTNEIQRNLIAQRALGLPR